MKCKINFDVEGLLQQIKAEVEESPETLLDDHVGERIDAVCPECANAELEILPDGVFKCPRCGATGEINCDVKWED